MVKRRNARIPIFKKSSNFATKLKTVGMTNWQEQAVKVLEDSLYPVPQELNVLTGNVRCRINQNVWPNTCVLSLTREMAAIWYLA